MSEARYSAPRSLAGNIHRLAYARAEGEKFGTLRHDAEATALEIASYGFDTKRGSYPRHVLRELSHAAMQRIEDTNLSMPENFTPASIETPAAFNS